MFVPAFAEGTLTAEQHGDDWLVPSASIEKALAAAPPCEVCGLPCAVYVIVKYRHHDHVQFELCASHGADAALSYGHQGQVVVEVALFPFHSEGWLKPRPRKKRPREPLADVPVGADWRRGRCGA